jgi:hypothetical protein
LCLQFATQPFGWNVIDERARTVDLDDRQPFAIARLELGVAGDVDLAVRHALGTERQPRELAEVAALRRVEDDVCRYG